ncbi:hypothetical protein F4604DRAFT_1982044 [Suillus subluteus]|nr:hypothetical protein F4604DRAFT_1982044 [Suillus subluteus]
MIITAAAMAGVVIASSDELTNVRCTPTAGVLESRQKCTRRDDFVPWRRQLSRWSLVDGKGCFRMHRIFLGDIALVLLFLYTFGNPIDYARMLSKGAVVMSIWMLSSISLVTYWKFSKQNSPEVICLAADRAVFLVTSWNWDSTLKARRNQGLSDRDTENATEEEESTKDEEEDDNEGGISVSALLGLSLPRFEVDDTSSATSQAGASLVLLDINYEEESEAVLSVVAVESHSSGNHLGGTVHITSTAYLY